MAKAFIQKTIFDNYIENHFQRLSLARELVEREKEYNDYKFGAGRSPISSSAASELVRLWAQVEVVKNSITTNEAQKEAYQRELIEMFKTSLKVFTVRHTVQQGPNQSIINKQYFFEVTEQKPSEEFIGFDPTYLLTVTDVSTGYLLK